MRKVISALLAALPLLTSAQTVQPESWSQFVASAPPVTPQNSYLMPFVLPGGSGVITGRATVQQLGQYIISSTPILVNCLGLPPFSGDILKPSASCTTTVQSIGGKTVSLGAAFTTTGAGAATLAFPSTAATFTLPAATDTLAGLSATQTLSNKTLSSPTLSGTVTFPDGGTSTSSGEVISTLALNKTAIQSVGGISGSLQILKAGGTSEMLGQWVASASGPFIYLAKSRGATVGSLGAVVVNDTLGTIRWMGDDGSQFDTTAQILVQASGTIVAGTAVPGTMSMQLAGASGALINSLQLTATSATVGVPLSVTGNITSSAILKGASLLLASDSATYGAGQFTMTGATDTTKQFWAGIDTTDNIGVIQAYHQGVGGYPLSLQPNGGIVSIGGHADAGGGQLLQVVGNAYLQGGMSLGSTTSTTGGLIVANNNSAWVAGSNMLTYSSGTTAAYSIAVGPDATHYSNQRFGRAHGDGTNLLDNLDFDTSGSATLFSNLTLGANATIGVSTGNLTIGSYPVIGLTTPVLGFNMTSGAQFVQTGYGGSLYMGNADGAYHFQTAGTGTAGATGTQVEQVRILHTAGATNALTLTGTVGNGGTVGTAAGNLNLVPATTNSVIVAPGSGSGTVTLGNNNSANGAISSNANLNINAAGGTVTLTSTKSVISGGGLTFGATGVSQSVSAAYTGATADSYNWLLTRTAAYSGGTSGFVNALVGLTLNVSGTPASYEWAENVILTSSASTGQHVAIAASATATGTAEVWGMYSQFYMKVAGGTAVGMEIQGGRNASGVTVALDIVQPSGYTIDYAIRIPEGVPGLVDQNTLTSYAEFLSGGALNIVLASTFQIDGSTGLSCSGSPTGSFATHKGIVTHC